MRAEASAHRWSEPLIIKRELDSIAIIELGVGIQPGVGIATFDIEFAGMAVVDVLGSAIGYCYKNLS